MFLTRFIGVVQKKSLTASGSPAWDSPELHACDGRDEHSTEASAVPAQPASPSALYRAGFWRAGLSIARVLPRRVLAATCFCGARLYWLLNGKRREVVIRNLMPALDGDRAAAAASAKLLFGQFGLKLADLWRYESGLSVHDLFGAASGWEHYAKLQSQNRGVLLLTMHLGNWEFGGPWLTGKGVHLQVLTLAEPGRDFTRLRQESRARWDIETLVIGSDPFAFLDVIRRLESGATVALLIDRPPPATAIRAEFFGRPFNASVAAAELARASGCALLPVYLPRSGDGYEAHILPEIPYDRARLRDRNERAQLTQKILDEFQPIVSKHSDQWFHFVPIWREESPPSVEAEVTRL